MYLEINKEYKIKVVSEILNGRYGLDPIYTVVNETDKLEMDKHTYVSDMLSKGLAQKSVDIFIIDTSVYEGGSDSLNKCINDYIIEKRDKSIDHCI